MDTLAEAIYRSDAFTKLYQKLLYATAVTPFKGIATRGASDLSEDEVHALIRYASIFSSVSEDVPSQSVYAEVAARIVSSLWIHYRSGAKKFVTHLYMVLAALGNFPSANHLLTPELSEEIHNGLPVLPFVQAEALKLWNTREIAGERIVLTNFQADLWDDMDIGQAVAVSGPTSSGKSYVLTRYLLQAYAQSSGAFVAIYMVPTKTLISEVSSTLHEQARQLFHISANVLQAGIPPSGLGVDKVIYVLTQERLAGMLDEFADELSIDMLVVDEAQALADGKRGNLLIRCVERVCDKSLGKTKVLFGSPMVGNADYYNKLFGLEDLRVCVTDNSPVLQNLFVIKRVYRKPSMYRVEAICGKVRVSLGEMTFDGVESLTKSDRDLLAYFVSRLSGGASTLVYVGKPMACAKQADAIARKLDLDAYAHDKDYLEETARFIEDYIHPDFSLARCIRKGVAFHFGRLPHVLTRTLEDGFSDGHFPILVSTSTLLHGVNLPARNIFLLRPGKGKSNTPLSHVEFWNLAGRAGRLGKDFEGNVFLVEAEPAQDDLWSVEYIETDRRQKISGPLEGCCVTQEGRSRLLDFMGCVVDGAQFPFKNEEEKDDLTATYNKMLSDYVEGKFARSAARQSLDKDPVLLREMDLLLGAARSKMQVPSEIISRHTALNPLGVDSLYRTLLQEGALRGRLRGFIPVHPQHAESYLRLQDIFFLFRDHFDASYGNSASAHAAIALDWMKGVPLKKMITEKIPRDIAYAESRGERIPTPDDSVKDLLALINDTIAYSYANMMKCYIDIVKVLVIQTPDLFEDSVIPPLDVFLEMGVSDKLQVAMMHSGLSRMTAIELTDPVRRALGSNADIGAVREWFQAGKWRSLHLPRQFIAEIDGVFPMRISSR